MNDGEFPEPPYEDGEGMVLLEDDGKKHIFDNPKNIKRVIYIFFASCVVMLALDIIFFFHHKHLSFVEGSMDEGGFPMEGWFGYYCFYGFVACVLLVLAAKHIMRPLFMRGEDYYER